MTEQQHLTHIDEKGDVRMVDVSDKDITKRVAVAEGFISMHPDTLALIVEGKAAKGDVLACARVAGVMAAKQTSTLIPMCHPIMMTEHHEGEGGVRAGARRPARGRPRGHPCDHHHGRHGQNGYRNGGADRGKRGVPDHLRYVQSS